MAGTIKRISARQTFAAQAVESEEGVEASAPYRIIDLNTYSDVGSSFEASTREVMVRGRRPVKGSQTSRSDAFGYNIDNTVRNVEAQVAAFMYKVPENLQSTHNFLAGHPLVATPSSTFSVTAAGSVTIDTPQSIDVAPSNIVAILDGTNDRKPQVVASVSALGVLSVTPLIAGKTLTVTGAHDPATANVELRVVGVMIGAGATIQGFADRVELTYTTNNIGSSLKVGEWVFIGGAGKNVGSNEPFYARVLRVDNGSGKVIFDATTRPISTTQSSIAADTPLFRGAFLHDGEDTITLTNMRNLSKDKDDKTQVEVVRGCFASEMAINVSERSFVNMDFTFIGSETRYSRLTDSEYNAKYGTIIDAFKDAPVNTSTDVYRQRLVVDKVGTINTAAIHGLVQEFNVTLNNNLTEDTGIGLLGNDGTSVGSVGASGTMTAYFVDLAILEAVRCNCTASVDIICARKNEGFVLDVPALTLSSNGLTVSNDSAVTIDVDKAAFESKYGFVLSYTSFAYLPDEAMPPDASDCDC